MNAETITAVCIVALPVLAAIILHEVAHGWVAFRFGDPTAARMGRLTLNPISHIDLFGTVLLPLLLYLTKAPFLFGYAKPVPVNFSNLNHPKRDMIWVAAAGPLTNILIAAASVYFLKFSGSAETPLALIARYSFEINVMLASFNLLPLPPLDGGRVLVGLLPEPYSSTVARIEPYGFLIILVLIMTHTLDFFMGPLVYFVSRLLGGLVVG